MAAAPVSRENSGPLEQAFQQTVISSQDDFLLDTAKSISSKYAVSCSELSLPPAEFGSLTVEVR